MDRLLSYLLATIGAAIGLYLVYDGYQAWMTSENISTLQTQVTEISTQVIRQYARRPTRFQFGTLSVATLTNSNIVPKSAITTSGTTTTITNPMGGTYNVLGNGTSGITAPVTTFAVFADNISESSCETIVKTFNTSGGSNGGFFYGYAVTTTGSTTPGTISTQFPDTDDNASSNCNTASSNGTKNVAIEFVVNGNTN